jgi:tetratricopeptide (TPR) repeat protein
MGTCLFDTNNHDRALKYFNTALKYDQLSVDAHVGLGNTFYKMDLIEKAITHFKEAISLE